jgi:hypothetical protein
MTFDTYHLIILILGAALAALVWVLDRSSKRLAESIPASLVPFLSVLTETVAMLARLTPTPLDDELAARLRELLAAAPSQADKSDTV